MDWRCSCLCNWLIPSVTERSVLSVKELSFPQTAPTDDASFQLDWAGAYWGRRAGDRIIAGLVYRLWIVVPEIGLFWAGLQALNVALLYKNKKEGWSAGASPVATPMPKSVPR